MIENDEGKWHFLAITRIPGLLRGITSRHNGDFYCLNCFHSYSTENRLKEHEKICYDHKFCLLKIPDEDNNILKSKPGRKSLKHAFVICADLECLLLKMNTCDNNPNKSYTIAKALHEPSGYSLVVCCSFDKSENEQTYYRGRDCMKKFCEDLKEHVNRIINFEMKPMIPLTDEEKASYENQQVRHICKKEFCIDKNNKKEYNLMKKVRDHCHNTGDYRGATHSICNLRYKVLKEIPAVFHNGSTYDYHFIIKYLAREFNGHFDCLGENTEKYITFSVPINKVINNENNDKKSKEFTYRTKFIDSCRFMHDSLSNLVDNLSELKNRNIPNDTLIKRFHNTYQLSDNDINKFKLLLRKGVYPHEYMDSWRKFRNESLPDKEYFYRELNKEHISDEDYAHAHEVWN